MVVGLEAGDELLHVVDVQIDILGDALGFFDLVDDDLKGLLGISITTSENIWMKRR